MLGDFASLDVQNTYRGSDAYVLISPLVSSPIICLLKLNYGTNYLFFS
ncbi:hypothetical protein [Piscirickettsia salmonis]|nr:hypothetical protein [Piscirickettsia salmonis]